MFPDRMKTMKRKILLFFTLSLIVLGASWALLRPEMFKIHDFVHGVRIAEMHRALEDGQVPVRWTENFGFGYGMPLFEFYGPLPYYVGAFLYGLGISLVTSVKILMLLSTIGTALGAYFLGKTLFSQRSAGVLVAAAYTLAPYRALNLFVRGAISEAWGMMALPWILYGIVISRKNPRNGFYAVLFGCVVLLLSHNLTALIAAPFLALFAAGMFLIDLVVKKQRWKDAIKRAGVLLAAVLFSLGISAFYIVPALLEKNFTQIESTILSGYFDFSLHFLYIRQFFSSTWGYGGSEWGPFDPISFYLGFGQLVALVISIWCVCRVVWQSLKNKQGRRIVSDRRILITVLVLVITLGALWMSLQRSISVWRAIELLTYIQFPWRYISVASLGLALLTGVPLLFIRNRPARFYLVTMYLVLQTSTVLYFQPEEFYQDASSLYYDDPDLVASHMSEILPDYIPLGSNLEEIQPPEFKVRCLDVDCTLAPLVERGHERLYFFEPVPDASVTVEFAIADFPGWTVYADTQVISHEQTERGTIQAQVPAETQTVGVQLRGTVVRNTSDIISLVSLLCIALVYMVQNKAAFFRKDVV